MSFVEEGSRRKRRRVIVVDDDEKTLKNIRKVLSNGGVEIAAFKNPVRALEEILDAVGILPYLDEIVFIEESPSERRDTEQLISTLAQLRIPPESS